MTPRPFLIGGKPAEQGSCVVPLITRFGRTPLARPHSSPSTRHSLALRKHMPTKGHSSLITNFRYSAGPMLDLGYVREHMDAIEKMARDRGVTLDLAAFRELDSERRQIIQSIERLNAERNKASEEIARLSRIVHGGDKAKAQVKENAKEQAKAQGTQHAPGQEATLGE